MSENLNELLDERELLEMERKERQAVELDQQIKVYANLAWQNLLESAKCLKQMRDTKLYLELGYTDFEDYTEKSLGIKQRQAYTYIKAYEDLGERFLQSNASLGITKLGMLSQLPAPDRDDFVEAHDLAGMSVDEVKKLIAENDQRGEQIDLLTDERDNAIEEKDKLAEKLEDYKVRADDLKDENEKLSEEIEKLETELEAEKNKPAEVAVAEPSKEQIEKIKAEASAQTKAELEKVHKKEIKEVKDKALEKATDQFRKSLDEARANVQSLTAEKEELIKKREELQKQLLVSSSPEAVKFSFYSESLQNNFKKLFECIVKVREENPETADKYKCALIKYYESLEEQVRGI